MAGYCKQHGRSQLLISASLSALQLPRASTVSEGWSSTECSALRANPFSKGTDLICRLPSSALFYRPEAANLGDLMRFRVRLMIGREFPWVFIDQWERTGCHDGGATLYQRFILFSRQADSKEWCCQRAKRTLPRTLPGGPSSIVLPQVRIPVKEFEPFSLSGEEAKPHSEDASFSFRTD